MKVKLIALVLIVWLAACAGAQTTSASAALTSIPGNSATEVEAVSPERAQLNDLLASYESAYNHKDLPALLEIYPGLKGNEKDFKKAEWHLSKDPNVFSEKMTLSPSDVQIDGDKATVRARRNEVYVYLETRSEIIQGDANMYNTPVQDPSPVPQTKKKVSNKTDDVVMELHKTPTGWQIASLTATKAKKH